MPEEKRSDCWWLILRDGTAVPGDRGGGVMLFAELRLTRPLGRFLRTLRLSPLIDVIDKIVALCRSSLSRFVPEGPAPRRFP